MRTLLMSAALLAGLVSPLMPTPAVGQDQASARSAAASGSWVDDARLKASILEGAVALMNAERAREVTDIAQGLAQATCTLELPPPTAPTAAAGDHAGTTRLDSEALYERALDAVAIVGTLYLCDRCTNWHVNSATGFFITPGGALVTNYHVVDQTEHRTLVAMTHDGRVFPILRTLAADKAADVAIVQVEPTDQHGHARTFATLPLASGSRVGQNVRVVHHADGRYYTLTQGIVSRRYVGEDDARTPWMTITADYARGSSGGPLFDDAGRVIGMVASTSSVYYDRDGGGHGQNLQMVWKQCVPVENIRKLLAAP